MVPGYFAEEIQKARPQIPKGVDDGVCDNWTPLLAIAEIAKVQRAQKARDAAAELSVKDDSDVEQDLRTELLRDIWTAFDEAIGDNQRRMTTSTLIESLKGMEEAPWSTHRVQVQIPLSTSRSKSAISNRSES